MRISGVNLNSKLTYDKSTILMAMVVGFISASHWVVLKYSTRIKKINRNYDTTVLNTHTHTQSKCYKRQSNVIIITL